MATASIYEIMSALSIYGGMDLKTALSMKMCDKTAASEIITDTVMNLILASEDEDPTVWYARLIGEDVNINMVSEFKNRIRTGDEDAIVQVFQHDEVVFNIHKQTVFLNTCFDLDAYECPKKVDHMIRCFTKHFCDNFLVWKATKTKSERVIAYSFFTKLIIRALQWAIENYKTVKNLGSLLPFFHISHLYLLYTNNLDKARREHMEDILDVKVRAHVIGVVEKAIKMCKAWTWSLSHEKQIFMGIKGGIYHKNTKGRKCYNF